tara:strand:- start:1990 stop:2274 length:285 start_codon:yes stop_codon:yes gene_type:complete
MFGIVIHKNVRIYDPVDSGFRCEGASGNVLYPPPIFGKGNNRDVDSFESRDALFEGKPCESFSTVFNDPCSFLIMPSPFGVDGPRFLVVFQGPS